jgi:hypothetical protein
MLDQMVVKELCPVTTLLDCQSESEIQSHFATDSQSVCLGVEPHLGLMTRYLLTV